MMATHDSKKVLRYDLYFEFAFGLVVYAICAFYLIWSNGGPLITNDYYQYESVANNALQGEFGKTSIIHFDAERSHGAHEHGVMPAPLTTFPAGFPLLITALAKPGLPVLASALSLSLAAGAGLLALLALFARWVGLSGPFRYALLALFACNAVMLIAETSVLTDSIFTFVCFAGILLLILGSLKIIENKNGMNLLIYAYILIGFSYWLRYAGIFVLLSACSLQAIIFLYLRNAASFKAGFCSLLGMAIIAPGLLRNWWLVDTWKGGNEKPFQGDVVAVTIKFIKNILSIIFGHSGELDLKIIPMIIFIFLASVVLFCFVLNAKHIKGKLPVSIFAFIVYIAVYSSLMFYAGMTTVISFGPRMFVPIIPAILCVFVLMAYASWRSSLKNHVRLTLQSASLGAFMVYAGVNVVEISRTVYPTPGHVVLATILDDAGVDGSAQERERSILSMIDAEIGNDAVFIANQGQALGHLIQRPVLSLASSWFSQIHWDEESLKEQARRYEAQYLLLVSDDPSGVLGESAFLESQFEGSGAVWLEEIAANQKSRFFKINSDKFDDQSVAFREYE